MREGKVDRERPGSARTLDAELTALIRRALKEEAQTANPQTPAAAHV